MGKRLTYSCEGKAAFLSRRLAKAVCDRMRRAKHAKFSLYRCKGCRHWHIGTKHVRM